jgi:hypothetical protein
MLRIWAVVLLVSAFLVPTPAAATKYAGEFLKIPVGPRAIAMGGAFTAIADDATSPHWNPAGMIYLPYREVVFQHAERFGNLLNQDYLSAVFPLGGPEGHQSALGVSVVRLAVDDIPITPLGSQLRPGQDFDDYGIDRDPFTDDFGQNNGTWDVGERLRLGPEDLYLASSSDLAVNLSYARHRGRHFAFGANVKFVRQSLPNSEPTYDANQQRVTGVGRATSFGMGLDAGAVWMPNDAITLGAVAHDLTTTYLAWSNGTREIVAPTVTTGAAFSFRPAESHAITWALDLGFGFEDRALDSQIAIGAVNADVRTGVEYWYRNTLALRTGAEGKNLAFGAGLRYKQVGVDYAASLHRFFAADDDQFPDDADLDATHLVSLAVNW